MTRPFGPRLSVPSPVPPTVPWPQSLHCGPMNGVAFCLVGIPPRPEPRPPQVRADQGPGQLGGTWDDVRAGVTAPPSVGTAVGACCPAGRTAALGKGLEGGAA